MSASNGGLPAEVDAREQMHDLFVLALLAAHPHPEVVRGQFRLLLSGLAASHSRYAFGDDFVITVRRSLLRFDRMLNLVLSAKDGRISVAAPRVAPAAIPAVADAEVPLGS